MCMLMNLRHTEEITYEMRSVAFCVCDIANIVGPFLFLAYHPNFQKLYTVTYTSISWVSHMMKGLVVRKYKAAEFCFVGLLTRPVECIFEGKNYQPVNLFVVQFIRKL